MKIKFVILFIFSISVSFSYDVYLLNGKYLENCKGDSSESSFHCTFEGRDYLITPDKNGFSAVKVKGNNLEVFKVDAIDDNGMLIFETSLEPKKKEIDTQSASFYEFSKRVEPLAQYIKNTKELTSLSKLEKRVRLIIYQKSKHYESIINSNSLKITLENGKKKVCKRTSTLRQCPILNCGTDSNGNSLILYKNRNTKNSFHHLFSFSRNSISSKTIKLTQLLSSDNEVLVEHSLSDNKIFSDDMVVPSRYKSSPRTFDLLTSKSFTTKFMKEMKSCEKNQYNKFKREITKALNAKDNEQMVQYIDYSNNRIRSYYVNQDSLPNNKCYSQGSYYSPEAYNYINKTKPITKRTITSIEAQELFDIAKNMKGMAWEVIDDGCYARSHLMAKKFEEKGIYVDKVWLDGRLKMPTNDNRYWKYHTAPIVYVDDGNGIIQETVIDPSLMNSPAPIRDWTKRMGIDFEKSQEVSYPNPLNSRVYKDTTISITNSKPYRSDFNYKLTDEEKTKLAIEKLYQYTIGNI